MASALQISLLCPKVLRLPFRPQAMTRSYASLRTVDYGHPPLPLPRSFSRKPKRGTSYAHTSPPPILLHLLLTASTLLSFLNYLPSPLTSFLSLFRTPPPIPAFPHPLHPQTLPRTPKNHKRIHNQNPRPLHLPHQTLLPYKPRSPPTPRYPPLHIQNRGSFCRLPPLHPSPWPRYRNPVTKPYRHYWY